MLLMGIRLMFMLWNFFPVAVKVAKHFTVLQYLFLEYEESDGTQMSKFSSFFFKLRHHTSILKNPDTKELAKKIRNKASMTMIRTPKNKSVQFFVQIFFLTHVFLIRDVKGLNWYNKQVITPSHIYIDQASQIFCQFIKKIMCFYQFWELRFLFLVPTPRPLFQTPA